MKRSSRRLALIPAAAAALCTFVALGAASPAQAHHTTIECVDPSGVWRVTNSESDKAMTFTSPQGPSGSITAGGSTTVTYVGTSLTIVGVWSNGVRNTSTGQGDCDGVPTTSSTSTSTTSSTSSTTQPEPTTTSTTPEPSSTTTSVVEVTDPPVPEPSSTTTAPTTTVALAPPPSTTVAPAPVTPVILPETR